MAAACATLAGVSARILIVEDDAELARLLAEYLHDNGYRADVVGRGEEAVVHITQRPPDVVILDLMLPGLDGKPKKKMRSPGNHRPAEQLNSAQVLSEFISQLEKLEQLIILSQKRDLNKIKVPISIAPFIKLKLGDVLLFYTAHIQRHLLQAERAMKAAGYRSTGIVTVKKNITGALA